MAGQYLQGPQSVGEKGVPTYRSGTRTGLGCIAIRSSEKKLGWALSLVDLRRLDQAGRGILVPLERGCEF